MSLDQESEILPESSFASTGTRENPVLLDCDDKGEPNSTGSIASHISEISTEISAEILSNDGDRSESKDEPNFDLPGGRFKNSITPILRRKASQDSSGRSGYRKRRCPSISNVQITQEDSQDLFASGNPATGISLVDAHATSSIIGLEDIACLLERSETDEVFVLRSYEHLSSTMETASACEIQEFQSKATKWLMKSLEKDFIELSVRIMESGLLKGVSLQRVMKTSVKHDLTVFEKLMTREVYLKKERNNAISFAITLSECLDKVCRLEGERVSLVSNILRNIDSAIQGSSKEDIGMVFWYVRHALIRAIEKQGCFEILQIVDVKYWSELRASYVSLDVACEGKFTSMDIPDHLRDRLRYF
ncbi:hypothetical protein N7471_013450 [Penicillium samsonianum]|uniref:uncharacterized protein n=1 Tax=Penicillium samsonianum TaxID=1882272 RepID=UPI00254944F9|nr:uncharacterized protein N7471_013450 [Penicillium samsonianum]KAJ6118830.1 hypothetical protein N7471_013450 [Penicillium samsonianum]